MVCHSLAVPLWLHHAARGGTGPAPARVLLVAPPSPRAPEPALAPFLPPPLDAGRGPAGRRRHHPGLRATTTRTARRAPRSAYGLPLKLPTTVVPGGGHLNVDAGYGPWPAVERWCSRPNLAFPL